MVVGVTGGGERGGGRSGAYLISVPIDLRVFKITQGIQIPRVPDIDTIAELRY